MRPTEGAACGVMGHPTRHFRNRKRNRSGRADRYSAGKAKRFIAVSTLCVSTAKRSHAALAPKRPQGSTPSANSFFTTSWTCSMVPAFSRCHWINFDADYSSILLTTRTHQLLILADCGGANSARARAWKYHLQHQLCDPYQLTVCHYPPGASKWHPIEHQLFSPISFNWAGKPLESYETVVKYIQTTKNSSGLRVKARLINRNYEKGEQISQKKWSNSPSPVTRLCRAGITR